MKELRETIHNASLTKTQQMIAEYILDNSADACFMTSTEIASKLGVSESSVIRFSRSLGFNGFMDFQKSLRKDYQDKVLSISSTITVPAQRVVKRAKFDNNSDYIKRHLKNAAKNLESVFASNTPALFEEAADINHFKQTQICGGFQRKYLSGRLLLIIPKTYADQCGDYKFKFYHTN